MEEKTKELEENIPGILKEKDSRFTKLKSFFMKDIVISFSDKPAPPFLLYFEAVYERKLKNGKIKEETMPVNMTPIHCPLCGKNYALEAYREAFMKYMSDLGIDQDMIDAEYEGQIENMGDDLDLSDPEFDAQECMSYWSE